MTASNNFYVGMHLDVDKRFVKLGMMIHTTECLHFDTNLFDIDLMEGHRNGRKQRLLRQSSHKVINRFGGNLHVVDTCWSSEPHAHLLCAINIQGRQSN